MMSYFVGKSLTFDLSVHVKPGPASQLTVVVCPEDLPCHTTVYHLEPTQDWSLDATVDQAHIVPIVLPVGKFNHVTVCSKHNDVLILGYQPKTPGIWRFSSVPQWDSGQQYSAPDQFDEDPRALPLYAGDKVQFYCRAIASYPGI